MIRAARPDEVALVCEKIASLDTWRRLDILAEDLRKGLEIDKKRKLLVYEVDGSLLGAVVYRAVHGAEMFFIRGYGEPLARRHDVPYPCEWSDLPDMGYIGSLAVFDGQTGRGIGLELLTAAHVAIKDAGNTRVCLFVSDFNKRARKFYERAGYVHIGTVDDCIRPGNRENMMEKDL